MTPIEQEEYIKKVTTFKKNSFIQESQSLFVVVLLFILKLLLPDRTNYRILIVITVKDCFLLSISEYQINKLQDKGISSN
jgi:hypothetical protein